MAKDKDKSFSLRVERSLGAYGELYPSMARRIAAIVRSQDPQIRTRVETLTAMSEKAVRERAAWFAERYDLTPTEARIALSLADGGTIAGYAADHAVSPGTVKTHLKAIFAKTGVHRQSALATLVARAAWTQEGT